MTPITETMEKINKSIEHTEQTIERWAENSNENLQ